jgi:hypothetical protein
MHHRRRWHTYLYPKDIRARYVSEIEALTEELLSDATFRRRSLVFDLVVSGFRARIRQWRTHKWLVPALGVCAITAGLLLAIQTSPAPTSRPAASSQQRITEGVPPKQCKEAEHAANGPGYLCYVVLNPKTGATESATFVRLTSQQADCLRSQRPGRSVMTCLPTGPHGPSR